MNGSQFTFAISLSIAYLGVSSPLLQATSLSFRTKLGAQPEYVQTKLQMRQAQAGSEKPPPRPGSNTSRGGSRSGCNIVKTTVNQDLYALVPSNQEAFAAEANPTLWFYLPYDASKSPLVTRLTVQTEGGSTLYTKSFSLSGTPGIAGIRLPQSLKQGISYRWYLTMVCDANTDGASVNGWIRFVQPKGALHQKSLPISQRLALYKQSYIWHDRLTLLANQRGQNSQVEAEWQAILKEISLEQLAKERILGTVKPR
jgi:hypothetical protein